MNKTILNLILGMLLKLVPKMSAELRKALVDILKEFEKKAKATPNIIDDIIVAFLIGIFSIEE